MANTTEESGTEGPLLAIPDFGYESWEGGLIAFCCIAGLITNVPTLVGISLARGKLNQKLLVLLLNIEIVNLVLVLLYLPFLAAGLVNKKQLYPDGWCIFLAGMSGALRNYRNWLFISLTSWVRSRLFRHVRGKSEERFLGKGKPLVRNLTIFGCGSLLIYAMPAFIWGEAASFNPVLTICRLNPENIPVDIMTTAVGILMLAWGIIPYVIMLPMILMAIWRASRSQFRVCPAMYFDSNPTSEAGPETEHEGGNQIATTNPSGIAPQPVNVLIQPVVNPSAPPEEGSVSPPVMTDEDRQRELSRMKVDFLFCLLMCSCYWLSTLAFLTVNLWHKYGPQLPLYVYRVPEYPIAIEYLLEPIICLVVLQPIRAALIPHKGN